MIRMSHTICFSLFALAGCVVGPDYTRPAQIGSEALDSGKFLRAQDTAAATPVSRWWEGLGDPILSGLVETGLEQAPAIEAAAARIRRTRLGIASARASMLPAISGSGTYIYADLPNQSFGAGSGATEFVTLGFDTQWEVDLWGGKARDFERASADAGAAEAQLADVQVSLSAEIARTYVTLRAREASERLLDGRRFRELQLLSIASRRLEGGTGSAQQVAQVRQRLGSTDAELATVKAEIIVLRDGLAVLTGEAPGSFDRLPVTKVPLPPTEVAVGNPAAMLARRPDVLAAERRLAASIARIGVAKARRFPAVSLLGLIGIGGSSIGDVFDTSQLSAIAAPRLTWNFLDFGRTAAAVQGAEAAREEALADYRASVLAALQDAEASLARFGVARIALARAGDSLLQGQEILRLERLRGEAGTISNGQVIEAESREIDTHLAEINDRARLTLAYVTLAKSLGLGWQINAATGQ
ncbi:MAG: efflux transporter outer membrane subunit [Novosphingobium sp.]|nr:efflux transporter outer membrane subunit [Novosphingobium sp.]